MACAFRVEVFHNLDSTDSSLIGLGADKTVEHLFHSTMGAPGSTRGKTVLGHLNSSVCFSCTTLLHETDSAPLKKASHAVSHGERSPAVCCDAACIKASFLAVHPLLRQKNAAKMHYPPWQSVRTLATLPLIFAPPGAHLPVFSLVSLARQAASHAFGVSCSPVLHIFPAHKLQVIFFFPPDIVRVTRPNIFLERRRLSFSHQS